jgi:OOP family OmpA-OmpF porin
MKKIILSAALLLCGSAFAQKDTTYNRLSLDLGIGACNVLSPNFTERYNQSKLDPVSIRVGARYMFNNIFGAAWVLGYDNISSSKTSLEFQTHNISSTLQAYANLSNLYNFSEFTDNFGLLLHTGAGLSTLQGKIDNENAHDYLITFVGGITPQYVINKNLTFNLDLGFNFNMMQTKRFDLASNSNVAGLSHNFGYGTLGVSYYGIGKRKSNKHADWTVKENATKKEIEALRAKLDVTEAKLIDSDNDGVANFLDIEPNTPTGSIVNSKGQAIVDMDGDGILDSEDFCPTVKGTIEFKGCPISFVQESKKEDNENNGNDVTGDLKSKIDAVSNDVTFETNGISVKGAFKKQVGSLAKLLNENPSLVVTLNGHCDNVGEDNANNKLSETRAIAVKDYLVSKGVASTRIYTKGFGITKPKMSNDTEQGRSANRRVEFIVKSK